jgi:hypothetical protein
MARIPASVVATGGLVGGYAVARWTQKRPLGGVALAAAGALAAREWNRAAGAKTAVALTGLYVAGFAGAHPLARKVGAWPAVAAAAGTVGLVSAIATRQR